MSVAALEAVALDETLASGTQSLWQRFYKRTKKILDSPWEIATDEDFRFPQTVGKRPWGYRLITKYLERVHALASTDERTFRQFIEVVHLLVPPSSLMSPANIFRVLSRPIPKGKGSPWRSSDASVHSLASGGAACVPDQQLQETGYKQ